MKNNVIRLDQIHATLTTEDAVGLFIGKCEAENQSKNTICYYRYRLNSFCKYLAQKHPGIAASDIAPLIIRDFLTWETYRTSASTAAHSYITLSTFFNFLKADGYLIENPLDTVNKPRKPKRVIETFSPEQVQAIINACGNDWAGTRDKAIIITLYDCGLRASELCDLRRNQIDWNERTMLVVGKGDKERLVPFGENTKRAIMGHIGRCGDSKTPYAFVNVYGEQLDRRRLIRIIQERCKKANITGVRCSPHTFRHTFAVQYLRNGGDVFSLQKLLGHTDLAMTRIYADLSEQDVQQKHRLFSPADRLAEQLPKRDKKQPKKKLK